MPKVIVVGAGPAGLMAAEVLSAQGVAVQVYDAMPSAGRKFLLAGLGGLNLTHAEPQAAFLQRYTPQAQCEPWLQAWGAQEVREWAHGLGIETFVGTSQRVFPVDMKAAPLLRAWLHRLRHPVQGEPVTFHMRHRWTGQMQSGPDNSGSPAPGSAAVQVEFHSPAGLVQVAADAVVLALGGGSWAKLGSDGAWVPWLKNLGVAVSPLAPANCGFDVKGQVGAGWSSYFSERFSGAPLKAVAFTFEDDAKAPFHRRGECVVTATGLEGSLVYAVSARLRQAIQRDGQAVLGIDLKPDWDLAKVESALATPRGKKSLSNHLQSRLGLQPLHTALLHECLPPEAWHDMGRLARAIKHCPVVLGAPRPLDEAISTAGGVAFDALGPDLRAYALPKVWMAGEMLDWEAPTGGYLLTACLASGRWAGQSVARALAEHRCRAD